MNALNTISQTLTSSTTTGIVVLGAVAQVIHAADHKYKILGRKGYGCSIHYVFADVGLAIILNRMAFNSGRESLKISAVALTSAYFSLKYIGMVFYQIKLDVDNMKDKVLIQTGAYGLTFFTNIVQHHLLKKAILKAVPAVGTTKAFNSLPVNLITGFGMLLVNIKITHYLLDWGNP